MPTRPTRTRRQFLGLLASAPLAVAGTACLGSSDPEVRLTVDGGNPPPARGQTTEVALAVATAVPFAPAAPPSDLDPADIHGFIMPIEGACLPGNELSMPGALLEDRDGVHEGVDFYWGDSCVLIERGTAVLAAYEGVVLRIDHDYVPLTLDEVARLTEQAAEGDLDGEAVDRHRGRQVWIDHGNGVVTRYCHLTRVTADLVEGVRVPRGHVLGGVGDSGLPESLTAPGTRLHLHWEVRVGESFLGEGDDPETVRALYQRLVEPRAEAGAG